MAYFQGYDDDLLSEYCTVVEGCIVRQGHGNQFSGYDNDLLSEYYTVVESGTVRQEDGDLLSGMMQCVGSRYCRKGRW